MFSMSKVSSYAVIFGAVTWVSVTLFAVLLMVRLHDLAQVTAEERLRQITIQINRAIAKVNVDQAYALTAASAGRLFLVVVARPEDTPYVKPDEVSEAVWKRWLTLKDDTDTVFSQDQYLFQWVTTFSDDNQKLRIFVGFSEARALAAYHAVQRFVAAIWLIFTLAIVIATAVLERTLRRRAEVEDALKLSDLSLRTREADLLAAQSIAKFGSWRMGIGDGELVASPEYMALFEVNAKTCPRNIEEWIVRFLPDSADAEDARQKFKRAHESDLPYQGVRRVVLDSGKIKWIQFYARPMYEAKGVHIGFIGIARDITDEHLAAEQLSASEERFRVISENMQDIVTLHARDGTVLYTSPSLSRLLGHRVERAIGNSPVSYLHPDDQRKVIDCVKVLMEGANRAANIEYRIRVAGGDYSWLETQIVPVFHENGRVRHFQAVSRDINARKAAESDLARRTSQLSEANRKLVQEVARRHTLERRVLLDIEMALSQVGLELHDELGQDLTGIALLAKSLERRLQDDKRPEADDVARISDLVNRTIGHTRMISHGLSPYIWGESGLNSALAQLAHDIDSIGTVSCIATLDDTVQIGDEAVVRGLYRIAQEATNNAIKHGGVTLVRISLKRLRDAIQLVIADDGRTQNSKIQKAADGASVLHSISHRAQTIEALVTIRVSVGSGTVVRVLLPMQKAHKQLLASEVATANAEM